MKGQPVHILLDTGSDKTLIDRHLIHSKDVFKGNHIIVNGIGGSKICDEVVRFYIAGEGVSPIGFYGYVMDKLTS